MNPFFRVHVFNNTNLKNPDLLHDNRIAITRYVVENFEHSAILYKITIYFKSVKLVRNETRYIFTGNEMILSAIWNK